MKCKQVIKSLKYDYLPKTDQQQNEMEAHAQSCETCGQELVIRNLVNALVSSYGNSAPEESPWDDIRLANGIKSRIREMSECGASSWETAIISVRGWLVAFGVTAILLLVLSNQLAISNSSDQNDRDQISQSNAPWSEEIISNNSSSSWSLGEEPEHAQ